MSDEMVAVLPGVTSNARDEMGAMRKLLHDELIRMTGQSRRSGIRWTHWHGETHAGDALRSLYADDPGMWALVEEHYLPPLAVLGDEAVLIVAECDAVPGWETSAAKRRVGGDS